MNKERLTYLYSLYQSGTLTQEERVEWQALLNDPNLDEDLREIVGNEWYNYNSDELVKMDSAKADNLVHYITGQTQENIRTKKLWPRIAIAASIVLIAGVGFFAYQSSNQTENIETALYANDIAPGKNGATLTLANGKKIVLSDAANGELAKEAGVVISKTDDGQLIYEIRENNNAVNQINTLSTTNGETYRVRLPDQSEVWLNAASTLKYPASFANLRERRVELSGEAYFQISKNKDQPFIVTTARQELKVLGTHFNVSAYTDEKDTKTTLLEGSVQLSQNSNQVIIKPGQQASTNQGSYKVEDVDGDDAIAWKNGYFQFNGKTLENAMLEVTRWYDVEIEYKNNNLRKKALAGTISKYEKVSSILKTMELTGALRFRIEGRKIIVE